MKAFAPILALAGLLSACAGPASRVQALSPADLRVSANVAEQVRRCYRAPRTPSSARGIVTRLLVQYGPDGNLAADPLLADQQGITPENQPYSARMAEAARLAVIRCSPIRLGEATDERGPSIFYLTFSFARQA